VLAANSNGCNSGSIYPFVPNFLTFPRIYLSSSMKRFNHFELKYNVYFNSFLTLIMNFFNFDDCFVCRLNNT